MNVMIIGGGKVGAALAAHVQEDGHHVQVLEHRHEQAARLRSDIPSVPIVQGSGTDPNVLERAGIRQADLVAAVTGDDEVNLVVTSLARFEFGVPHTVARVNNPKNAWLYDADMGVDHAINQAELIARSIAATLAPFADHNRQARGVADT